MSLTKIVDLVENTLDWYNRERAGFGKYYTTRFLMPYLSSVALFSLVTILFRKFAWFMAVACAVGLGAFFLGFFLAMAAVMDMNIHGGPRDTAGMNAAMVIIIIAVVLTILGIVCFSSMVLCFAFLRLQTPPGW